VGVGPGGEKSGVLRQLIKLVLFVGVPLVLAHAGRWGLAAVAAVAEIVLYGWSCWRMERVPCWACAGAGTSKHWGVLGWLWPEVFRSCWLCKGTKGRVRLGVRVFRPDRARQLKS